MKTFLLILTLCLSGNLTDKHYFEAGKRIVAPYHYTKPSPLSSSSSNQLKVLVKPEASMSANFIQYKIEERKAMKSYLVDEGYLTEKDKNADNNNDYCIFFPLIIENGTNKDYTMTNDYGLPIIQEALNENGKWQAIEQNHLSGDLSTVSVTIPKKSALEISALRYKGDFKTKLRFKVAIQGHGIITTTAFEGSIDKRQFLQ